MRLPNAENAVVDVRKIRDYCLSAEHPRGRHKARLFASALGLTAGDAETLQRALLDATQANEAISTGKDDFGERYTIDFLLRGPVGEATIRSLWIVRRDEQFPRLVTCYVI